MPPLNGVELFQLPSVSHPQLPIILMSGYGLISGYGAPELAQPGITAPVRRAQQAVWTGCERAAALRDGLT